MTAIELIYELQKYDGALPVHLAYDDGTGGEVIRVFKEKEICGMRSVSIIYLSEDKEER